MQDYRIAVLIPCYNEERSIPKVVQDFRNEFPEAKIYVYDNNSVDQTRQKALERGAIVRPETLQGKGNVIRRMFADIEADIFILVDGDDTYDASSAPRMVRTLVQNKLDMVSGKRVSEARTAYRRGHRFGNAMLTGLVSALFGKGVTDMLSGYRVFSRRFVKSFPALSAGFEIETEITVHALQLRMATAEIETPYRDRTEGSVSKLRTYRDGWRIFATIALLLKEERPLQLFGSIAVVLIVLAVGLSVPVIKTYIETGLVPRFPTAILSSAMTLLGFLCLTGGLILDSVTRGRQEAKRLRYLQIPALDPNDDHQPAFDAGKARDIGEEI